MKIRSGEFDVLESGSVIQFQEESIEFAVTENMTLRLRFETDDESSASRMDFANTGERQAELVLYNFNNSLGTGNTEPLSLGTLNNRRLYFNFRIYALNNEQRGRTIYYTWYLGEEVTDG